jgi:ABC-type glycerol-3-phosphate transport system substrate-binding protein
VVRVACPADSPGAELVSRLAKAWAGQQQARVEVVRFDPPAAPPEADILILRPAELPTWVVRGAVLPVPDSLRTDPAYGWSSLLPIYRAQLLLWESKPWALPLVGESPLLVYRSDLYKDQACKAAWRAFQQKQPGRDRPILELRAPASWEELAEQAEFFRQHHPRGTPGPSLPPLPADDRQLDRLFYQVAAPHVRRAIREDEPVGADHLREVFAFHYDLETSQPRLAEPGFVESLELLQKLKDCRPPGASAHPEEAFLDDRGGAVLGVIEGDQLLKLQKSPTLHDKLGISPIPGALRLQGRPLKVPNVVPYLGAGGWFAAVLAGSKNPEAAWSLLANLTGPEQSGQIVAEARWGGGAVRQEQIGRDRWEAFDLDPARALVLKDVLARTLLRHGIKNPVLCLRIPNQASYQAAAVKEFRAALTDPKISAKQALEQVVAQWKELDQQKCLEQGFSATQVDVWTAGVLHQAATPWVLALHTVRLSREPEKARREYRTSLGLLGDLGEQRR